MSPDNVILENDDIHEATIIDFGIAKDLDASSATIVGDGFAGKLNYVAPEQLGDFGREVGPWTDVYSLGLVILAVAQGKNVDMSGSLVDAIDKRRKGPDISAIPDNLQPLVHAMLRPDPKERLRSMDDVLAMLDGARIPSPTTVRAEVAEEAAAAAEPVRSRPIETPSRRRQLEAAADHPRRAARRWRRVLAVIWYVTDGTFGLGGGGSDRDEQRTPGERRSAADTGSPADARPLDDRFGAAAGALHLARHRRGRATARRSRSRCAASPAMAATAQARARPGADRRRPRATPGSISATSPRSSRPAAPRSTAYRQIRSTEPRRHGGDADRASRRRPRGRRPMPAAPRQR